MAAVDHADQYGVTISSATLRTTVAFIPSRPRGANGAPRHTRLGAGRTFGLGLFVAELKSKGPGCHPQGCWAYCGGG